MNSSGSKIVKFTRDPSVTAPKKKRKQLIKKGICNRAEEGRLLGFQSPYSSTFRVLLSGNRLVHSINVTFDDGNFREGDISVAPAPDAVCLPLPLAVHSEEASDGTTGSQGAAAPDPRVSTPPGFQQPYVQIERCDLFDAYDAANLTTKSPEYFDEEAETMSRHRLGRDPPITFCVLWRML